MANIADIKSWLEAHLTPVLEEFSVPGAAVAVYAGGEVVEHAAGVLNKATGVEATPESLFQIGSITKLWTTTLVMQLVDEGKLDLDLPVRSYLPDFALADDAAAAKITLRQLLCHTAGFEGDIFTDTGRGDDCVEKFVATLATDAQLFSPGERFSYNNAGFCVLGRVIEVLRGKCYDDCLREYLFTPLGLTHAAASPYEAIMHRAALGHIRQQPEDDPEPAPVWCLARSNAPAGAALAMSPRELLTFARMHLDGGATADGTRILTQASVTAMQAEQVRLPQLGMMGDAWGLGWELFDMGGTRVIGHDGGTIGQSAFLRIVPGQNIAVALLTNGGDTISAYRAVVGHLLRELAGVTLPPMPVPPERPEPFDAARYVGTYSCDVFDLTVSQDSDGRVWLDQTPKGDLANLVGEPERNELVRWSGDTLISTTATGGMYQVAAFVGDDGSGRSLYLHSGRATRRAS